MKTSTYCALSALLSSIANAAPLNKRDVVWVTEWEIDTVVIPVTETVWVDGSSATTQQVVDDNYHTHTASSAPTTTTSEAAESTASSAYVAPSTTASAASTSVYVAPTTSSTSEYVAPTSTSTSEYVAPTTTSTSENVAPTTTSTSVYVAPTTTSTSAYVAATTAAAPATSTTSTAPATSSSVSSSDSASGTFDDVRLSFYAPGLGSCGNNNVATDYIVALAEDMMAKSLCNQAISITYNGVTAQATIVDTCPGCAGAALDLSPGLWAHLAGYTGSLDITTMIDDTVGILNGATWSYD